MKIKPHKGGRDKVIVARVSEKEKNLVDTARDDLSYSDFLVQKAAETLQKSAKNSKSSKQT